MAVTDSLPNLLILSDLHLGEDIKPTHQRTGFLRHVVLLERELEAFLEHYTRCRHDGRPWRLIVNGDMVDFLSICLLPHEGEIEAEDAAELAPEDRVYGLGTRPRAARTKMRRVLERHSGVFRALARFLGAGNEVAIVAGNHDVEFHWPVVQETLRRGISSLWPAERAAQRSDALSVADIESRITFHPWFYFEEGVVWAEHGHQYDDYCSFDYVLNPVAPRDDEIVMNVGAAGLRYVTNHFTAGSVNQTEDMSFWGYLRWGCAQGLRDLGRLARSYAAMAVRLLTLWRVFSKQPEAVEARRQTHRDRLRALAAQCKLSPETLGALDDLRRRPVIHNFTKLVMALMLDRLLLASVATLLVLVFVLALPWAWALGAVAAVLGGAWVSNHLLARARVTVDPIAKLKSVPEKIRRHVRAPFVVFGHSHDPVALELEGGGWYFNTGTWVATERPGLMRAFTHLMIRHGESGPEAALCQWRDGESRVFRPDAPVPSEL